MKRLAVLLIVLSYCVCPILAQQLGNVHALKKGQKINIYYDLTGEGAFEIKIYFSRDGGGVWEELNKHLEGDIGQSQLAGSKKKIKWDIQAVQGKPGETLDYLVEASDPLNASQAGTFTDNRDGERYRWIKIGNQVWMEENLNYKTNAGSWCYDGLESYCDTYGKLYDWENAKSACPNEWHLPSDAEWMELTNYLGGDDIAGGKMKATGKTYWISPNAEATNSSGFTALPGGFRSGNSYFYSMGSYAYFWSSSDINATRAWKRGLYYNYGNVSNLSYGKDYGFSVRCIKN